MMPDAKSYRHVINFSSGITSWAAALRVVEHHGTDGVVLLFADTRMEDEDNYRFMRDAEKDLGVPLVKIADGRTTWEVFRDVRFLGNSRLDPCSRILKRELLDKWVARNCDPEQTIRYFGLDWTEPHRVEKVRARIAPWRAAFPLCDAPYKDKPYWLKLAKSRGIQPPRMYEAGFAHANCGGACVKAGQQSWAILLQWNRARYLLHEKEEEGIRQYLGKDVSILRDRRGGESRPLTLREFRGRVEQGQKPLEGDWGSCSCMTETESVVSDENLS